MALGLQLQKPYFVFDEHLSVSMETKRAATQLPALPFLVSFKALKNQRKGEAPWLQLCNMTCFQINFKQIFIGRLLPRRFGGGA